MCLFVLFSEFYSFPPVSIAGLLSPQKELTGVCYLVTHHALWFNSLISDLVPHLSILHSSSWCHWKQLKAAWTLSFYLLRVLQVRASRLIKWVRSRVSDVPSQCSFCGDLCSAYIFYWQQANYYAATEELRQIEWLKSKLSVNFSKT